MMISAVQLLKPLRLSHPGFKGQAVLNKHCLQINGNSLIVTEDLTPIIATLSQITGESVQVVCKELKNLQWAAQKTAGDYPMIKLQVDRGKIETYLQHTEDNLQPTRLTFRFQEHNRETFPQYIKRIKNIL